MNLTQLRIEYRVSERDKTYNSKNNSQLLLKYVRNNPTQIISYKYLHLVFFKGFFYFLNLIINFKTE